MRLNLNLASEPFRRDRPILVASIAVAVLMIGTLAMLIVLATSESGQMAQTRQAIDRAERQLQTLVQEQTQLEAVLRRPENAAVLEASLFLNQLIHRKGISWTRMFADLEEVMPHNVKLIDIRPEVTATNDVLLNMTLGAQASEPVITMVKRLEGAPLFGHIVVHTVAPPSQTEPLYRYRVSVNYAQKL